MPAVYRAGVKAYKDISPKSRANSCRKTPKMPKATVVYMTMPQKTVSGGESPESISEGKTVAAV